MFSLLRICEVLYENYVPVALDAEERNAQGQGGGLGPEGRWRTTSGPSNEAKCQANLALWEDGRILKPAKVERKHPGVSVAGQCWCFNARRVTIFLMTLALFGFGVWSLQILPPTSCKSAFFQEEEGRCQRKCGGS